MAVQVTCGPQPTLLSLLSQLTNYYCALIGTELAAGCACAKTMARESWPGYNCAFTTCCRTPLQVRSVNVLEKSHAIETCCRFFHKLFTHVTCCSVAGLVTHSITNSLTHISFDLSTHSLSSFVCIVCMLAHLLIGKAVIPSIILFHSLVASYLTNTPNFPLNLLSH